ncbi:hypothetical protein AMTRI_Chr11g97710 [Amborella trichopoda]
MSSSLYVPADETVVLHVTHSNLKSFSTDMRFPLQTTVEAAKERLWKKCGTSVDSMCLELYDVNGIKVCDLTDNMRPLGVFSPQDGYRMHVIDLDPSSVTAGGWLEDTSLVEKYSISEDAYDKLGGTFRKFKEKLASEKPSANIVGDRCEVEPGEKRGVVKFVGKAGTLAPGFWVGVGDYPERDPFEEDEI